MVHRVGTASLAPLLALIHSFRASKERDSSRHHKIVQNGYNLGRDWLVERATQGGRWKAYSWKAVVEWRSDLLPEGSDGWCSR
jgi:hypothetical protein